jgi:hypothetical protein
MIRQPITAENKSRSSRHPSGVLACIALCLNLIPIFAMARQETQGADQVLLRLLLPDPSPCLGRNAIASEIELRNLANRTVGFEHGGIGSALHFQAFSPEGDRSTPGLRIRDTTNDPSFKGSTAKISIQPGGSYRTEGSIDLNDDFFSLPGFYKVSMTYDFGERTDSKDRTSLTGAIDSNWVFFELRDCKSTKQTK